MYKILFVKFRCYLSVLDSSKVRGMKRQIHLKPEDLNKSDKLGLTYNLGQAHKRMLLKQSGIMQKFGLTARQSLIIAYLSTHKKDLVTQKTLEEHLHLTNPTITVMVKSMIDKGLVSNRRAVRRPRIWTRHSTKAYRKAICASSKGS